ncbi:hypothetical protein KCU81_g444, partial [Aureobasidium melanogenum]
LASFDFDFDLEEAGAGSGVNNGVLSAARKQYKGGIRKPKKSMATALRRALVTPFSLNRIALAEELFSVSQSSRSLSTRQCPLRFWDLDSLRQWVFRPSFQDGQSSGLVFFFIAIDSSDFGNAIERFGSLFIGGLEILTMTTPWSIEPARWMRLSNTMFCRKTTYSTIYHFVSKKVDRVLLASRLRTPEFLV